MTSVFIQKRLSSVTYPKFRRLIHIKPITSDACSVLSVERWDCGLKFSPGIEVGVCVLCFLCSA